MQDHPHTMSQATKVSFATPARANRRWITFGELPSRATALRHAHATLGHHPSFYIARAAAWALAILLVFAP
jgi:hypothetical protein